MGNANRQSLVFSEGGQLSQAIPRFRGGMNATRVNANRAIRIATPTNAGPMSTILCVLGGDMATNARDSNHGDNCY